MAIARSEVQPILHVLASRATKLASILAATPLGWRGFGSPSPFPLPRRRWRGDIILCPRSPKPCQRTAGLIVLRAQGTGRTFDSCPGCQKNAANARHFLMRTGEVNLTKSIPQYITRETAPETSIRADLCRDMRDELTFRIALQGKVTLTPVTDPSYRAEAGRWPAGTSGHNLRILRNTRTPQAPPAAIACQKAAAAGPSHEFLVSSA